MATRVRVLLKANHTKLMYSTFELVSHKSAQYEDFFLGCVSNKAYHISLFYPVNDVYYLPIISFM